MSASYTSRRGTWDTPSGFIYSNERGLECAQALNGIPDPAAFVAAAKRLAEALDGASLRAGRRAQDVIEALAALRAAEKPDDS